MSKHWATKRVLNILEDRELIGLKRLKMLLDPIPDDVFLNLPKILEDLPPSNRRQIVFSRTRCMTWDGEEYLPPGQKLDLPTVLVARETMIAWLQNNYDLLAEFRDGGPTRQLTRADFFREPSFALFAASSLTNNKFPSERESEADSAQSFTPEIEEQQAQLWEQTALTNLWQDIMIGESHLTRRRFRKVCLLMAQKWRGLSHAEAYYEVVGDYVDKENAESYVSKQFVVAEKICALDNRLRMPQFSTL